MDDLKTRKRNRSTVAQPDVATKKQRGYRKSEIHYLWGQWRSWLVCQFLHSANAERQSKVFRRQEAKHWMRVLVSFRLVVNRDSKFTNFVEFRTHKVIYRRYAGLFFSLCVDITDNELAYLECIYLFVEILDNFFSNVCELNLVFNFHKVYLILDEFILAGELQETSKRCA
ncbi:hypothetical protein HID58_059967 [Brassica napus]|uniref:AP complex mu/sigma subunit domain-containing protein n=1 Tax=Brassica napus TaxID=3708 RepID=A0ABQ7ZUF4_BRANA|nr:hypothetical protein HID58_059967 [Brassica napus]